MPETPYILVPDAQRLHGLQPRLEQAARSLELHLRGYQTAGRAFQRLFLALFPPCFDLGADPAFKAVYDRINEIRAMITENNFPNNHLSPLEDDTDQIAGLCVFLSLLRGEAPRFRPAPPPPEN